MNEHPIRHDVSLLTPEDLHLFNEGTHYRVYRVLGSHVVEAHGTEGTHFGVWAPNAASVSVMGDFNGWDRESHPLRATGDSGIWEGFVPGLRQGVTYKFVVRSRKDGYVAEKADPYAIHAETPPHTGSKVWDLVYSWDDEEWMRTRAARNALAAPMAMYEVHLGSWMRAADDGHRWLGYREVAPKLADYCEQMGFTHVELLPIMEHPYYASWGYQSTGYFAPTSRFGTPQDFMFLIDHLHQRGIGVILDWVPSHFPTDGFALSYFDGTHLYEHEDPRQGFHQDWKSYIFNYGRHEVRSFLMSSAFYWLDAYHVDGLRVDAVASMLYLDYSREDGEWIPNEHGGRENLEAVAFLRHFNEAIFREHPDVQTIAEESTAWPMVSRPLYVGGLGFGLKWDMGWMHDTLKYMSEDPIHRKYHHSKVTFRMLYAWHENYVLPLSHDEVVHGKGSLIGKMAGTDWQEFANLRALFGYMYGQAAKKLLFMGGEIGQRAEWDHDAGLQWELLEHPSHAGVQRWVRDLNWLYRSEPALHELDCEPDGFQWVDCNDADQSLLSFLRRARSTEDLVLVACNFTPMARHGYRLGVPRGGRCAGGPQLRRGDVLGPGPRQLRGSGGDRRLEPRTPLLGGGDTAPAERRVLQEPGAPRAGAARGGAGGGTDGRPRAAEEAEAGAEREEEDRPKEEVRGETAPAPDEGLMPGGDDPAAWRPSLGAWCEPGGVRFRVWAPDRQVVEVVVESPGRSLALERESTGHWSGFAEALEAGALYRYRLDGEGPFPDPASRFQPLGVHGPSRVVDPRGFPWSEEEWPGPSLEDLVLYELHVGTFTRQGTFAGAAERLPYLRDLGVTAVELMPLADFPGRRGWGYDGVDLFAPARVYGLPDDLRRLVDRAHALGLAVLLDVVYNHLGPDGNYIEHFSPRYLSQTHRTPWGPAVNLDGEGSAAVRELLVENALHWTQEYRFDGLRLDACRALVDDSPRHLLAEMQARVREAADPRRVLMIAEDSRNLAKLVQPESEGGYGLDAIWADDLHHQLRVGLAGDRGGYYRDFTGSLEDTARTLDDGWFFQGQVSEHFGGPRGTDPRPLAPRRFVVCLQNHDQIGNRAVGERLHHQIDLAAWRAASVLLLLAPETPLLFMGQEWGASSPFLFFTDHEEALGRLVTEGRRREFADFAAFRDAAARDTIPDPQAEATFTRSRLGWPERDREPHASLLRLYQSTLALRRELGLGRLERGDYRVTGEDGELVLEVESSDGARVLVVVRLGGAGVLEPGAEETGAESGGAWRVLLSTEQAEFTEDPRPARVGEGSTQPRVAFRRVGAVVLTPA